MNDVVVSSIDVRSETLSIADKKNGILLPVSRFALGGHEHIYTVVPLVFVLRMPIEVLEVIARTASKEAQESQDVEL